MAITVSAASCPAHLPALFPAPPLPILFSDPRISLGVQRRTGLRHSCSWGGVRSLQAELKDRNQPTKGPSKGPALCLILP